MRLRLISHPPAPMMLFQFSFLPTNPHPLPHHWDAQLAVLSAAELEQPRSVYALDSSAWLTEILEEVTFDVVSLTISVAYIDGHAEEWPLIDRACVDVLENILDDLRRSVVHPPIQSPPPAPPPTPTSPVFPVFRKSTKHKKQRSLLMQIVQSLIPGSAQAPQLPIAALPPPPPPPSPPQPSAEDVMHQTLTASKALRGRARSTVLDAYRRFVVKELKIRLPSGGYPVWVAESTLRRTEEHMTHLAESASSAVSLPLPELSFDCQTATVPEDLFAYDDDTDVASETVSLSRTAGTESDGSSIHTPDSTYGFRRGVPAALALADPDAEAFAALSRRALRLREHLLRIDAAQRNAAADEAAMLAIAQVRGRRRAWLNRQLRGGSHMKDIGFATPMHSSPLARHVPLTADNLAAPSLGLLIAPPRLFPVVEDSGEESDGWGSLERLPPLASPRRHAQVRVRTRSVRSLRGPLEIDLEVDGADELDPPVLIVPPPIAASLPHPAPTVVAPLPDYELDLEFGAPDGVYMRCKEREYECAEWLPGVMLDCR
ncbi:hypothetical protein BC834DRAFT_973780 [Gloeopeniophorella convolvens]|nr:hypothetical protein BC834DRAFT_973780 [Gloeopeniophorella convolvens]